MFPMEILTHLAESSRRFNLVSLGELFSMATRAVTTLSICLCLTTYAAGQLSVGLDYDTDAIVDVKTLQEKWMLTESRIESLVDGAIKMLLPRLMEGASNLNISSTCVQNSMKIISGLKKLKTWAVAFLDASSKSIDGIMVGSIASFGAYDECLGNEVIEERSGKRKGEVLFRGQYCRVEVRPYLPKKPPVLRFTKTLEGLKNFTRKDTAVGKMAGYAHLFYGTSFAGGLCVPSGCSQHDINQLLHDAGNYIGWLVKAARCEIKEEKTLTPVMIGVISLYSFAVFLVLISSLVDMYCYYAKKVLKGKSVRLLCTFSLLTNFRKFTDTSTSSGTFSCLNGIRSLTMSWIILGHTYLIMVFRIQSAPSSGEKFLEDFAFQGIANGTFAVDTFFFISGMLLCYISIKLMKIDKKPFSFTMYVIHRLWRLLPTYIFVIAFMFLGPLMGSGPMFHEIIDHFLQSCERNWWTNILFINNFYDPQNMCIPHGWYLAVDMQFYLGALVILLPLVRKPKVGISIAVTIILASMVGSGIHTYLSDFPPGHIITPNIVDQEKYMRDFSTKPHSHAGPYCIGMLCGYLILMYPKIKIPKVVQVLGWCMTIVLSLCVVNGVQKWNNGEIPTFWEKMFYSSCHRVAWGLCIAWIVVSCSTGHGGIVNNILSWKVWIPMGRLTFLAYLVHPLVMVFYAANMRTKFHYDHITIVWLFFGHLVISYLIAFGGTMLIEAPFLSLEKVIFSEERVKFQAGKDKKQTAEDSAFPAKKETISVVDLKDRVSQGKNEITNGTFVYKL